MSKTAWIRTALAISALIALGADAAIDSFSFGDFSGVLWMLVGWFGLKRPGDESKV